MALDYYPNIYLYKRIVQSKLFIDIHFAEKIDTDNISDEAYFSKFHFIRLFKQIYNKTPHQYLTSVRLDKAKELLKNGATVSDVCVLVGFESVGSFSVLFKNTFGSSPTTFLANQLKKEAEMNANPLKFIPGCIASKSGWLKNSNFRETE